MLSGECTLFIRGDANADDGVDGSDPIFILSYLFQGGPEPERLDAADGDDSGAIDMTDAIYLNAFLFLGGPAPPMPFPIPGLDPTPDDIESACDFVPQNFAEFHTFYAERDITGDGVIDPLYIVPRNVIEIDPLDSTRDRITFVTLSSSVTVTRLVAAVNRVVYALTSGTTVYAMLDTDGNGIRNVQKQFTVPSPPIDAVLVDTLDGQALVTLHGATGVDELYLWRDNNADGFFDGLQQTLLVSNAVFYPKGLAVDATTGRLFVSGQDAWGDSAIVFYHDTDGDKLVDATPAEGPYIGEIDVRTALGTDDLEFLGLHFVAEARKLLIHTDELAPAPEDRLIACAEDDPDLYTVPETVGVFFDPVAEEGHSLYAKTMESGAVVAWLTVFDFTVAEYTDQDGNCAAETWITISLPNAAERSADAGFIICTVVFTQAANRTGLELVNVDLGWVLENNQAWELRSEEVTGECPDNPSGWARGFLAGGDNPARAEVRWSDGANRRTEIRGRAVHSWSSGPNAEYVHCCHDGSVRSTSYQYDATIQYFGKGWPLLPKDGGTFTEGPGGCGWTAGAPADVKKEWDNVNNWFEVGPHVLRNVSVSHQQNTHTRINGGRSDSEKAYQKVEVSIFCRPKL